MDDNKTIAAISTAQGEGGIGVIRISGSRSAEIADKVFRNINSKKLADMRGYTAAFGKIVYNDEELDEAVALVFRAPHSYTGEDVVEISCHGGVYITKQVLRAVLDAGAVPAQAGEFTKRAFLNGKIDLTEAEAVIDIITAKSRSAARSAMCVKEGALRKRISSVKDDLLALTAHLSAWADYPEEDIAEVDDKMIFSTASSVFLKPAVSLNLRITSPTTTVSSTTSLVVPGISVTMLFSLPESKFISVLLPTFGRPAITVSIPSLTACPMSYVDSRLSSSAIALSQVEKIILSSTSAISSSG